jgi:hypothetical protein
LAKQSNQLKEWNILTTLLRVLGKNIPLNEKLIKKVLRAQLTSLEHMKLNQLRELFAFIHSKQQVIDLIESGAIFKNLTSLEDLQRSIFSLITQQIKKESIKEIVMFVRLLRYYVECPEHLQDVGTSKGFIYYRGGFNNLL